VLIIGRKGSIGRLVLSRVPAWPIDTTYFVDKLDARVDFDYFVRFLATQSLHELNLAAAVPGLNRNDVYAKTIPLPPLEEQKRIAAILDKADRLRSLREQAIAKLDELAQSIFLEMFGDPVTNPKGWGTRPLDSVVSRAKHSLKRGPFGGSLKKDIFVAAGYKVYEQQHAIQNDFLIGTYYIDDLKYHAMKAFAVYPGDFIVSCSGTVGKLARVPQDAHPGVINQALLKITLDEKLVDPTFFEALWFTQSFQDSLFGSTRGSGIRNFPPMGVLRAFPLIVPPLADQTRFSSLLGKSIDCRQNALNFGVRAAECASSLAQMAFSGALSA